MSTAGDDAAGGRAALAGFLYQMICTAEMAVRLDHDSEGVEAGEQILWCERFGQDAVRRSHGTLTLVQMKYSGASRAIGRCALQKIAEALVRSARRAQGRRYSSIAYRLVTNRPLGVTAQPMIDSACQTDPASRTEVQRVLATRGFYEQRGCESGCDDLRRFARTHGCVDGEVEDGLNMLLGSLLTRTVSDPSARLERADVVQAFTGCSKSKPLTRETIAPLATDAIGELLGVKQSMPLPTYPASPLDRPCVRDIWERIEAGHSVVVIEGAAGVGKSVALHRWAEEAARGGERWRPVLVAASDDRDGWVAQRVGVWAAHSRGGDWVRAASGGHADPAGAVPAIERLRRAAEADHRAGGVLALCVDGVDEQCPVWLAPLLRKLHRLGESQPGDARAVVIVAERDDQPGGYVARMLSPDLGSAVSPDTYGRVTVDRFSYRELADLAELGRGQLPESVCDWIGLRADEASQTSDVAPDRALGPLRQVEPPWKPRLDALTSPTVWRAFTMLPHDVQEAYCTYDVAAQSELAATWVGHTVAKVVARRRDLGSTRASDATRALRRIVVHTQSCAPPFAYDVDWAVPAQLMPFIARAFYDECLSAGLVEEDHPESWRWSDPWLIGHLARDGGDQ